MKRLALAALIAGLLVLAGCGSRPGATPEPESTDDEFVPVVSVTGELVPSQWAAVSAKAGAFRDHRLIPGPIR